MFGLAEPQELKAFNSSLLVSVMMKNKLKSFSATYMPLQCCPVCPEFLGLFTECLPSIQLPPTRSGSIQSLNIPELTLRLPCFEDNFARFHGKFSLMWRPSYTCIQSCNFERKTRLLDCVDGAVSNSYQGSIDVHPSSTVKGCVMQYLRSTVGRSLLRSVLHSHLVTAVFSLRRIHLLLV
jgi:hypothetical protein